MTLTELCGYFFDLLTIEVNLGSSQLFWELWNPIQSYLVHKVQSGAEMCRENEEGVEFF